MDTIIGCLSPTEKYHGDNDDDYYIEMENRLELYRDKTKSFDEKFVELFAE